MSTTVHLSGHLKAYTGGQVEIYLPGDHATISDALNELWDRFPALHDRILAETGEIRQHVNIFIGNKDVKRMDGLASTLDSNDLHIFNAVSGG